MFFPYPDVLHKLNRVMAARYSEIALALHTTQIPENKSALDVEAMLR